MWGKLIQALLTKWLTDANIKLSLPVVVSIIIAVNTWQTIRVNAIANNLDGIKDEIYNTRATISTQIGRNNELMFDIGQDILGTWVDRMAKSQKMLLDYIEVSDREKKRIIESIDVGRDEVISKSEILKQDYKVKIPDSLNVVGKRLNR